MVDKLKAENVDLDELMKVAGIGVGAAGRLIYKLLADYFERPVIRIQAGEYVPGKVYEFYSAPAAPYHNDEEKLRKNYDLLEEPFLIDDKSPWQPKIYRYSDREARPLAPYAKRCAAKDGAQIWAANLGAIGPIQ